MMFLMWAILIMIILIAFSLVVALLVWASKDLIKIIGGSKNGKNSGK